MSEDKRKPGRKYPKICSVCSIEKPESGWTPETYVNPESTICKRCEKGKPDLKKSKKPEHKKKSNHSANSFVNTRNIIDHKDLPFTAPYSSLNQEFILEKCQEVLSKGKPILVTLFRDQVKSKGLAELLLDVKGSSAKNEAKFIMNLHKKLPGHSIKLLQWPEILRSSTDVKRTTHPFISHRCRAAAIVHQVDTKIESEEQFHQVLFNAVHDETLQLSKDKWVIVGDETGNLEEFKNRDNHSDGPRSTMCWVAIPPNTPLEPLNSEFHCSGSHGIPDYNKAIRNLCRHKSIFYFTFHFDEGHIPENASNIGQDPHLSMWQETLPLVLEAIANRIKEPTRVDIFIEQVKELESGIGVIQPIAQEFSTAFDSRPAWKNLQFDQLWVVSKGEHPWIGYPDAIGQNVNRLKSSRINEEDKKLDSELFKKLVKTPYRQTSLNGAIRQLHKDTARPLVFLRSLADISIEDQRDYIEVFFTQAITESIQVLNQGEWQKLLSHMNETSKTKQGQSASTLIHQRTDISSTLKKLERESDQFNFCLAMLGTSNHIGARSQAELCESLLNDLIEQGYNPPRERRMKFKNLLKGKADNYFDFSHIGPYVLDDDLGEEEMHFLGAQAQSRALRGLPDDIIEAMEIESFLLSKTNDEDHIIRRMILRAELMMEKEEYTAAYEFLTVDLVKSVSKTKTTLFQDQYYMATLLKSGSLSSQTLNSLEILSDYIPRLLNNDHPSQRIAYWCVRWLDTLEEDMKALSETCLNHLTSLITIPFFTHDAPGIILSCELLDLSNRGYSIPKFNADKSYILVRENSQSTAQTWLEENPPNEKDWLAPLNFNYK